MLVQLRKNYLLLVDAVIIAIVPFIALFIRFDGQITENYLHTVKICVPYLVCGNLLVFSVYGFYRRMWRYATIEDLFAIVCAVSITSVLFLVASIYFQIALPKSIYFIIWIFDIGMIGFSRLLIKMTAYRMKDSQEDATRLLIIGAGDAGAMLARELRQHRSGETRRIVGYIDDDEGKKGSALFGSTIIGTTKEIERIVMEEKIDEIIIAIPSAEGPIVRRIAAICKRTGGKVKIVPGLYELIDGKVTMNQVRDIALEDLLRRDAVKLDIETIAAYIENGTILVTGAGGSIGSELCRQISKIGAKKILLLGRGENSIYEIHQELKGKFPKQDYVPLIADVRDKKRLDDIFRTHKPEVVFHAAAHKHVPLMEAQPAEAIKNNVFGTKNVAECADQFGVDRFVLISTDKAVNPTSVMGATKRIAELILQEINDKSKTKFAAVRFGNVLGSRGSVVPLFKKQIASGGPITVTHPEMTRYFMTIPEATQLVLQAGSLAHGGEVFLLDMGNPVKILDLAKDLIELHGLELGKDIHIALTGLRPGEKLYEELLTAEEGTISTKHEKIFSAKIRPVDKKELLESLNVLARTADTGTILYTLKNLIPTYRNEVDEAKEAEKEKIIKVS